jgi:hypothetical protein
MLRSRAPVAAAVQAAAAAELVIYFRSLEGL